MYMSDNKEFQKMMSGKVGRFTLYELWSILTNQNDLGVNTLMIQQDDMGYYYCCVDTFSKEAYLRKETRTL